MVLFITDDDAAQHIAMAREILGSTMNDDVSSG